MSLPSVDSVLSKLKGDGSFDQFRRTCLGHIQGEPSFRSYSEHVEVVSRRFLQNYKWRESSTKNEVRGRLRDRAFDIINSPDIQVGTPLIDVVEKVLESKAKELLPKIKEAIENISEAQTKQAQEALSKKQPSPKPVVVNENVTLDPLKSDLGDLSLPIDIPGLNTVSKSESSHLLKSKPKSDSTKDTKAIKPKTTLINKSASKDNAKPQKSVEKEKPKTFRIPKKSADKSEVKAEVKKVAELKTRATRSTDSKPGSENDGSDIEGVAAGSRKRPQTSSTSSKKRLKIDSSEESDFDDVSTSESDSDSPNLEPVTRHKPKPTFRRKSHKNRASRSPSFVVTRFKRSVKPNRRYSVENTALIDEDDSPKSVSSVDDSELPEVECDAPIKPLYLDLPVAGDRRTLEVKKGSVLPKDKWSDVALLMIKPKPQAVKHKKHLVKGFRSRMKTKTRISYFWHR